MLKRMLAGYREDRFYGARFWEAVKWQFIYEYRFMMCRLFGHQWEETADAEAGGGNLTCVRCYESHDYYW